MNKWHIGKSLAEYGIAIGLILIAIVCTTAGLETQMDVRFYDESYYLTQGIYWPVSTWEADYSPLYSLYYKALSQLEPNPVRLYYLSYRLWALVFGITTFAILRAFGSSFYLAAFWAIASICSTICLPLWPKAGHLAMAGVAILLLIYNTFKNEKVWLYLVCGVAYFILSWVRPEFFAGGIAAILVWGITFLRVKSVPRSRFKLYLIPGAGLILVFTFLIVWGLPVGRSGRGIVAFGQHFVHNWHTLTNRDVDILYDWVNWRSVLDGIFGQHDSIAKALYTNPLEIAQHVWFNFRYLFLNAFTLFFDTLFPFRIFHLSIALLVTIGLVVCEWVHGFNGLSNAWKRGINILKNNGLWLIVLALPSLLAALLFQPRPHYILPLYPIFLFGMARLSVEYPFPQIPAQWKNALGVSLLALLLWKLPPTDAFFKITNQKPETTKDKSLEDFFSPTTTRSLANKQLISKVLSWDWVKGRRIFDGSTGVMDYHPGLRRLGKIGFEFDYPSLVPLESFLKDENIEIIYLATSLRYDYTFANNPWWQALKARPESKGWQKIPIPECEDSLLIRSDLALPKLNSRHVFD